MLLHYSHYCFPSWHGCNDVKMTKNKGSQNISMLISNGKTTNTANTFWDVEIAMNWHISAHCNDVITNKFPEHYCMIRHSNEINRQNAFRKCAGKPIFYNSTENLCDSILLHNYMHFDFHKVKETHELFTLSLCILKKNL